MKIAYISNSIIPSKTANSINVMKMCEALSKAGNEVFLFCPDIKIEEPIIVDNVYDFYGVEKNFKIIKLNCLRLKKIDLVLYAYNAYLLIKKIKPDLVYGRSLYGCFLAADRYKTIFEIHAPFENFIKRKIFQKMVKKKKYFMSIFISDALKKIILSRENVPSHNLMVLHDGASIPKEVSKIDLLGKKDALKVGYVGNLYKGKGIEVISLINEKKFLNNIEFHVVGGLEREIKYWKSVIKTPNVYFYGFVQHGEISKYINSMDLCLLPNQKTVYGFGYDKSRKKQNISEFTSPLKLFEYMAHKKAIISSKIDVLMEILNDSNSILVDPENVDEWTEAILKLRDNELRLKLGNKAYYDFITNYTWDIRAQKIISACR